VLEAELRFRFSDELQNLFPAEERATRCGADVLAQRILGESCAWVSSPELSGKVLLHGHCHHKALMKMNDEESLLRKMGSDLQSLDSGCCGMAGPFGFERDKFALSQAVGERVLRPAVRSAAQDTLIVSDGFSCREQIYQATGRRQFTWLKPCESRSIERLSPAKVIATLPATSTTPPVTHDSPSRNPFQRGPQSTPKPAFSRNWQGSVKVCDLGCLTWGRTPVHLLVRDAYPERAPARLLP